MVYAREYDRLLAAEAQAAGAYHERLEFVPVSIVTFLHAALPEQDRRDPGTVDRRSPSEEAAARPTSRRFTRLRASESGNWVIW